MKKCAPKSKSLSNSYLPATCRPCYHDPCALALWAPTRLWVVKSGTGRPLRPLRDSTVLGNLQAAILYSLHIQKRHHTHVDRDVDSTSQNLERCNIYKRPETRVALTVLANQPTSLLTLSGDMVGLAAYTKAAAPATCGVDIDVPEMELKSVSL